MNLRTEMPETAAFIDALRDAFGKDGIDASIRKGMAGVPGYFHASEAGRSVGTQDIERRGITAAQMVIETKGTKMETKCSHCGQVSRNQAAGNGCHTCQRGIMVPA